MDPQNIPSQTQPPEPIPIKPFKSYLLPLIIGGLLLILFVGVGAFYLGKRSSQIKTSTQDSTVLSPTPAIVTPSVSMTNTPSITGVVTPKTDKDKVKNDIETSTNPKMTVEALDISPVNTTLVAYLGHSEKWDKFGVYFFNVTTGVSIAVYEVTESIVGRGGSYMDMTTLEFSPSGEAFFVNRTGINFPTFFVVDNKGSILYKGKSDSEGSADLGHATWVNGHQLIYLRHTVTEPQIFDITTKAVGTTQLPKNIFRLKANNNGTKVVAFSAPQTALQCESFDLHVYSYPAGSELKSVSNTNLEASWTNTSTVQYRKVTGCKKNTGESMFEYSPTTEEQQIAID